MKREPKESLCWSCRNAVPSRARGTGCSWSEGFVPVAGWCAFAHTLDNGEGRTTESYCVAQCPRFCADEDAKPCVQRACKRWTDAEVRRLIRLMQAGGTVTDAARQLGRAHRSVRDRVHRLRKQGRLAAAPSQKKLKTKTENVQMCREEACKTEKTQK